MTSTGSLPARLAPVLAIGLLWFWSSLAPAAGEGIDFVREIRPILSEKCFKCHGPDGDARSTDLRLDSREGLFGKIEDQSVISSGHSAESLLFQRISSDDIDVRMPPADSKLTLTAEQIDLIGRWIDAGAEWKSHWSLNPIRSPAPPAVQRPEWVENGIDSFVLARLEKEGLAPSPEAEKRTLIRRVTLDLTGLPPTPAEVETYLDDTAPGAYERLVDRLLASPAYGERMAWDWLDAARYADSNGYQGDRERTMWPWRDWVVASFNRNQPFDEFTIWQLAGDLLPEATFEQQLATGFCRNHMINGEGGRIPEENRVDYVMDMTETMGTVWLGLTLTCCRCHDHKYDPLTKQDYYSLFAFFNQTPVNGRGGDPQTAPVLDVPSDEQRREVKRLQREIASINEQLKSRAAELEPLQPAWEQQRLGELLGKPEGKRDEETELLVDALSTAPELLAAAQRKLIVQAHQASDPRHAEFRGRRDELQSKLTAVQGVIPKVMVMADMSESRPTYLLERGLYNKTGAEIAAAVPASLPSLPEEEEDAPNRLSLARWLMSPEQPLTSRVTVNRLWQQFFGVGLVKTPEDFGAQGDVPEQSQLLDWLAAGFRADGWNVKRLVRSIVTSSTYRQTSRVGPSLLERDPANRLLARGPRFRMPAWMLRDQALAASGLLSRIEGGPSVNTYQPPGVWEEATFGNKVYQQDHGESLYRRSLYTFWRRIIGPTAFFDNASRQTCTVKLYRTNTPLQALLIFNDVTYVEAARTLAQRALLECPDDDALRLDLVFQRLLARPATDRERKVLLAALERSSKGYLAHPQEARELLAVGESLRDPRLDETDHAAWTALCLAVLNLDECLTKE